MESITTKIISSNITEITYERVAEPKKNGTLKITFKGGGAYSYDEVPAEVYDAFMMSESKGKFFAAEIKGKYAFKKLEKEKTDDL